MWLVCLFADACLRTGLDEVTGYHVLYPAAKLALGLASASKLYIISAKRLQQPQHHSLADNEEIDITTTNSCIQPRSTFIRHTAGYL